MTTDLQRPQPRFIPTLTEVVDPASLKPHLVSVQPQVEAIVAKVMQHIEPVVERRIRDEMAQVMQNFMNQHWAQRSTPWQEELSALVQQAVLAELKKQV